MNLLRAFSRLALLFVAGCDVRGTELARRVDELGSAIPVENPIRDEAPSPRATPPKAPRGLHPPTHPKTFREAKRTLAAFYAKRRAATIYSGCALEGGLPDEAHCCLTRAERHRAPVEWEHVVPAAAFGQALPEWRDGHPRCEKKGRAFRGRKCARRTSKRFQQMEGDMHNLFPELGDVNGARGDVPMGLVPTPEAKHANIARCGLTFDATHVEPRAEVRGDVARAYLYMSAMYPDAVALDEASRALYEAWDAADPPDDTERARNAMILAEQGNENPWIR